MSKKPYTFADMQLRTILDADSLAVVSAYATERAISGRDALMEIIRRAFVIRVDDAGATFAPSRLPLADAVLIEIAELAAYSGMAFDECLSHVVAEGLNTFGDKEARRKRGYEIWRGRWDDALTKMVADGEGRN